MAKRRPETVIKQSRARIAKIHQAIGQIDYLCTGNMLERTKMCGRPGCACATDPAARHGPYFEWGFMRGGKLVHRQVSPDHAAALRHAIANYRLVKTLLHDWEIETERLIDAEQIKKN